MAASFFENQAQARRSTGVLVLLFAAAVVAIVAAVNLVAVIAIALMNQSQAPPGAGVAHYVKLVPPQVYYFVTAIVLAGILFQTVREMIALSDGGEAVALMCGGERIGQDSLEPAERRLLNIVQEMAIASGVAVPPVYVLREEPGINAFAAG